MNKGFVARLQLAGSYGFLVTLLVVVVFPFYWMTVTSFKGEDQMRSLVSMFWPSPWSPTTTPPPGQDRVRLVVRQQRHRVGQQHLPRHGDRHGRRLRAGAAQVPRPRLHVERRAHHVSRAAVHPLHPALRPDPDARPGRQPGRAHRRVPVLHHPVRDLAPHGLLRVHPRGARGSRHDRRRHALRRLQAHHPAAGRAGRARRGALRLHAVLERVPLRPGFHHQREAADAPRGPLDLHHGRRLRLGLPDGGSGR